MLYRYIISIISSICFIKKLYSFSSPLPISTGLLGVDSCTILILHLCIAKYLTTHSVEKLINNIYLGRKFYKEISIFLSLFSFYIYLFQMKIVNFSFWFSFRILIFFYCVCKTTSLVGVCGHVHHLKLSCSIWVTRDLVGLEFAKHWAGLWKYHLFRDMLVPFQRSHHHLSLVIW